MGAERIGSVRLYSPAQAGRIIDSRLAAAERRGFRGPQAFGMLLRPGDIAARFNAGQQQAVVAVRIPVPDARDMIESTELGVRISKTLVTGGQIGALVKRIGREGIEAISAHNIDALLEKAGDEFADKGVGTVCLLDGKKLAETINGENPERHFRLPKSEEELLAIFEFFKPTLTTEQLDEFQKYWIWVDQETKQGGGPYYVLRNLGNVIRHSDDPGGRCSDYAVLLVEDLKK